jgi:hypothetical protein
MGSSAADTSFTDYTGSALPRPESVTITPAEFAMVVPRPEGGKTADSATYSDVDLAVKKVDGKYVFSKKG